MRNGGREEEGEEGVGEGVGKLCKLCAQCI